MLELLLAFTTGLFVSLHCIGMCGGFVGAYSLRIAGAGVAVCDTRATFQPRLVLAHLLYNAGRLSTYAVLGGLMGLIGSFVGVSGQLIGVQGLASVIAGVFMILLGLNLGRWIPYINWLQPLGISRFAQFSAFVTRFAERARGLGAFPLGMLLGLMPCGPLYAMEINAAGTGSPLDGATALLAFGLGTVPALFVLGLVSSLVGKRLSLRFFRVAAVVIVLLGALALARGLAINGSIPHVGIW